MPSTRPPSSRTSPHVRYRVLLVDDDASVLRGLAAALEFDLDVVTCTSAERALTLLRAQEFHAVCSDYTMPGMNGLELLEAVARLPTPVACLLLRESSEFVDRGGSADQYVLMKPVEPARLSGLLMQLSRNVAMKRAAGRLKRANGR